MKTEQPLWGRGIMVSPQHFQQQAAYAAWSAEGIARMGLSQPWGVINVAFEPETLKLGRLQARHLHLRFPDGTLIDTDNADDLPPVLALEGESQDVVVVLALPLLRANGGNCLKPDEVAGRPVRYRQRWRDVRNIFGDDTVLRDDAEQLDGWVRNGVPARMSFGLYQGERLRMPVLDAIRSWVPPPPEPQPKSKPVTKIARLDSMSLFDSGQSVLKPGSTKLLVNSLVGIKAKPGWLIVVAGYTDNTGTSQLNQRLSQKRAEAVRDWMRDTGDVPESCFAVQGYGASRPAATNDTPEGRALNRRVEISLVPQASACQIPGKTPASSQDDGASLHNGE